MAIDYSIFPLAKGRPKVLSRRDSERERLAHERRVNAEVDARDQKRCRCCGRRGNPYAVDSLGRIHRAHIVDASRGGEYSARNLCSLCWICHALEHAGQVHFVGTNANERLEFEIREAAVVEVFGAKPLPGHVRIVL